MFRGNIDLLKINSNNEYCSFYENVLSSSFAPKITLPTRICDTTSTLTDNVYTNVIGKDHICGILVRPISDHQMYFCMMKENYVKPVTNQKYVEIEVCNRESLENFRKEIADLKSMKNCKRIYRLIQMLTTKFSPIYWKLPKNCIFPKRLRNLTNVSTEKKFG